MTLTFKTSTGAPCERLTPQDWRALAGYDSVRWLQDAVEALRVHAYPGATAVRPAVIADATVASLVVFDMAVLAERARTGVEPALDRLTLRTRLEQQGPDAQSPVSRAVFVGVWGRTGLKSLSRLGGYGQPLLLVAPNDEPDAMELVECDWRGIGVVRADACGNLEWLVPLAQASTEPWTNMRFEQLVDLAAIG